MHPNPSDAHLPSLKFYFVAVGAIYTSSRGAFIHLSLDEATVCKGMVPRELKFYQTFPKSLRKFTPAFHGVIRVKTAIDEEGYLHFISLPPVNYVPQAPAKPRYRSCLIKVEIIIIRIPAPIYDMTCNSRSSIFLLLSWPLVELEDLGDDHIALGPPYNMRPATGIS